MKTVSVGLAQYKSISTWDPRIGDVLLVNRIFNMHWYGLIESVDVNNDTICVIKSSLPKLLLTYSKSQINKNRLTLNISDIKSTRSGKYAIIQQTGTTQVWYI